MATLVGMFFIGALVMTGSAHFNRSMRLFCRQKNMTLSDKVSDISSLVISKLILFIVSYCFDITPGLICVLP